MTYYLHKSPVYQAKEVAVKMLAQHFPDKSAFKEIIPFVDSLQRRGATLHTRYEAACSYQWADTEAYRKKTCNIEAGIFRVAAEFGLDITEDVNENRFGAFLRIQSDPRGWPIEIIVNGRSVRLGGKS